MRYFLRVRVKKKWSLVRGADSLNKSKDEKRSWNGRSPPLLRSWQRRLLLLLLGHDSEQYVIAVFIL